MVSDKDILTNVTAKLDDGYTLASTLLAVQFSTNFLKIFVRSINKVKQFKMDFN
jgi:hypothetical protein